MRLAAQERGGVYPAHRAAIEHVVTLLRAPQCKPFTLLDPCAGEGTPLQPPASLLRCPPANTYVIELEDSRAQTLKSALPDAHVLAPASFFGCRASRNSFSFIWLNPPFDHAFSGCRVEEQFLHQATEWLMPGGVQALVCPEE